MLTEEQYTKASGLVQVASPSKLLISPIIAGFLLAVSDIKLLLIIEICTFFVPVVSTLVLPSGLVSKKCEQAASFIRQFKDGWSTEVYDFSNLFNIKSVRRLENRGDLCIPE